MPRPITWLPRLHEIRRSVANSVRSHYDRRDIEALFELQPRSAQNFVEMLPAVRIGTSHPIERDVRDGEILERLLLCLRATSLQLRATLTPLEMHAKCQC
jgi:hypothetical protein